MPSNIEKNRKISLIAAMGRNREIGKDNKLLWRIPEDLKRFRSITNGHPIIMGRKTYFSIGRPLPNRTNIVITNTPQIVDSSVTIANTPELALEVANRSPGNEEIFIIGGGQIYNQFISLADKLYLTVIDATCEADTFFPDYSLFDKKIYKEDKADGILKYCFIELEK